MQVALGEWLPDQQNLNNPGAFITNAVPTKPGYRSWNGLLATGAALPARSIGMFSTVSSAGITYNFAGTAAALYTATSTEWDDVSKVGGYAVAEGGRWQFEQYGNLVIAVGYPGVPQKFDIDTPTVFADLSATAPAARCVAVVRTFVVLGNVGNTSNRVQWSPYNTPDGDWTPSPTTLAGWADLAGAGGAIKAIVGGEYGVVFRENSIFRMTFVGAPTKFQFDEVEPGRGTPAGGSVVRHGRLIYYLGQDGFYVHDGVQSYPIGKNKIDKTFLDDVDMGSPERIAAAIDPVNSLVLWAYPGANSEVGQPNRLLFYNWSEKRWGYAEQVTEMLGSYRSTGYTMDELGGIYDTMEDMPPYPMDSRFWGAGNLMLAAFTSDYELAHFAGDPLTATVETPDFAPIQGRRALLTMVKPLIEGGTDFTTLAVGVKDRPGEVIAFDGNSHTFDVWGEAQPYVSSPYMRLRFTIEDGFDHFWAVEINGQDDGELR